MKGIKLRGDDFVVGLAVVREDTTLLTLCEGGYGKRTKVEEYRSQSRGGFGIKNIQTSKRNGRVVKIQVVDEDRDVILITAGGMIIRTRIDQVSVIGRNTQGVKVINLKAGDRLLAGAVVERETDEPEAQIESESD